MADLYQSGPTTQTTRFGRNSTPMGVGTPRVSRVTTPVPQTASATGAGTPSALTWLIGAVVLLFVLKFASEHERSPLSPAHIHIGGYNVLAIFTIVIITVVGAKVLVNRPWFSTGPQSGFASLVNAS